MIQRCTNKNSNKYADYGGRGISVCEPWLRSYEAFFADMGRKPSPQHTIDRIDNDGNYEPANCRWATPTEQAQNQRQKRNARLIEFNGLTKTLSGWAREKGLAINSLHFRLNKGWTVERALNTPARAWQRHA